MKKHIALILSVLMVVSLFAGCGGNTAEPTEAPEVTQPTAEPSGEVKITDGIFYAGGDGSELPFTFIHLYEDGTYYGKYFNGSVLEAGVWELVDEPTAYYVDANGNGFADDPDERQSTVDSEQTIILTPYSTGVPQRVAYVDDMLHNISFGTLSHNRYMKHDAAYEYNPDVDEIAIQLYVFFANNDIAANFILNHNRTFEDVTGDVFDSGVWEMTGPGEYALTYDFGGSAVLTINEDGKSGNLTKDDGTVIELRDTYKEEATGVALQMSLRAEEVAVPELPMAVSVRLDGYSDGTCQLIIEVAAVGAELIADVGTFEVTAAMQPTFHFEKAGDISGTPDYAGASADGIPFTVHYSAAVEPEFNGSTTPMTLDTEVTGIYNPNAVAEVATVVATMRADDAQVGLPMTVGLRIDCYSDGTAKLIMEVAQVGAELEVDAGTYEVSAAMQYTFQFNTAGEIIGAPDYATASDNSIQINVAYAAAAEVEFNGSTVPLTIDSVLNGLHVAG